MVNVGIVLLYWAFYLRFLGRGERAQSIRSGMNTSLCMLGRTRDRLHVTH